MGIEITPAIMSVMMEAWRPMWELTKRFEEATAWVENDDSEEEEHRISLGTRWELAAGVWADKNGLSIQHFAEMEKIVELARHYPLDVVEPYLIAGYRDIGMIAKSIEDDIDMDLLLSLESGSPATE